ncbi:hypothetical protein MRX96_026046 [Rhipicephalus microplus]
MASTLLPAYLARKSWRRLPVWHVCTISSASYPWGTIHPCVPRAWLSFRKDRSSELRSREHLYASPPILVLDEATSALDADAEQAVLEAVKENLGGTRLPHHKSPAICHQGGRPHRSHGAWLVEKSLILA